MTAPPTRWSRRAVVLGGLAATAGLVGAAGCSAAVTRESGQPSEAPTASKPHEVAPPAPPATTLPGSVEGAALEDALAAQAALVLEVGRKRLDEAGRVLVSGIRDRHLAHAAALRTPDPTDPNAAGGATPVSPSASAAPSTPDSPGFAKALDRLVAAEGKAAAAHRRRVIDAGGLAALTWGSLAISASASASILADADLAGDDPDLAGTRLGPVRNRAPMPVVTVVAAEQEMVRQLHAVVYGYQLALGRLTGERRDTATAELRRHRMLRDRLTARLLARKAEVPVAAPAYAPSTNPRSSRTAARLIRQMETALAPFCGMWLAAAAIPAERAEALGQLGRRTTVARRWGAGLAAWPGWRPA